MLLLILGACYKISRGRASQSFAATGMDRGRSLK
jgi:hypothetical protein